jgi:glycosyltransferase involved in cell wall biosynthesis
MSPPPKIAMFVMNSCIADARVLREAKTLADEGYEVRVYATSDDDDQLPEVEPKDGFLIVREKVPRIERSEASPFTRKVFRSLTQVLRAISHSVKSIRDATRWGPAVCHGHDLSGLLPAVATATRTKAKVIYDSHEIWRRRNRRGELRPVTRSIEAVLERVLVHRIDALITVSDSIAAWIVDRYNLGIPSYVIRNIASTSVKQATLRLRANLPSTGERLVLYAGRLAPARCLGSLIDSLKFLPDDVHLVLMGPGDDAYRRDLREQSIRIGVDVRTHLIPPVPPDALTAVLSQADLAVVCVEPTCLNNILSLPNKLFDTIQARVPVVATDLPEIRRIVNEFDIGVLVRPNFPIQDAIRSVLADPRRFDQSLSRASEVLTWEREQQRLLSAYRRLLDGEDVLSSQ